MRACFDEVCFGWLHDDRSFEPLTMPLEWRHNYQAHQILDSRAEKRYPNADPVFAANAHYPTVTEKRAASAEFYKSTRSVAEGQKPEGVNPK